MGFWGFFFLRGYGAISFFTMFINGILGFLFTIYFVVLYSNTTFFGYFRLFGNIATNVASYGLYFFYCSFGLFGSFLSTFLDGEQREGASGTSIVLEVGTCVEDWGYFFSDL